MASTLEINGIKITWLGHATFLIEAENKAIYIDPFVVSENLPKADYILITHEHFDHCNIDAIFKIIKDSTIIVAPSSCSIKLSRFKNTKIFVSDNESKQIDDIKIHTIPAYNLNKPFHPKGRGVGYILEISGTRIYHAGDTDFIPEMKNLNNITVALLPIGGTYTMDLSDAIEAAKAIKPEYFIPMHYNYLPELKVSDKELETMKNQLKDIVNVIILSPLLA